MIRFKLRKGVTESQTDYKRWLSLFPDGILSDFFFVSYPNSGVFFSVLITVYFYLQKSQSKA